MNIRKALIPCMMFVLLCSCSMLQSIDTAQQEILIRLGARTGTYYGIKEITETPAERFDLAKTLRDDVAKNILSLLSAENAQISAANLNMLLLKIPVELRPFVVEALGILDAYIAQANLSDYLDAKALGLLKAFFEGVVGGCDLVLLEIGEVDDGVGTNSDSRSEESFEGWKNPLY